MADDTPATPADDSKVVPLHEQRERADDEGVALIEQIVDESSKAWFQHEARALIEELCHPRPGIEGAVPIEAVAAGALGVAARDLTRIDLPMTYKTAVIALRECWRVDECNAWANKAAALAGYARQAKDRELYALATRIQLRARRRCGELISQIKAERGRRTDLELRDGTDPRSSRTQAASEAGLSERQRKTDLRIANIEEAEFERAVESPIPPTMTALAERGRAKQRPRWTPPEKMTVLTATEISYSPKGTLAEIAVERELAVLQAAWRDASVEARKRFLRNIGATALH
jgi:hypothetical protein